ncbi:MAG TPA: aspartate kinase, partial [Thermoanaerobaculia bacterium]|nr:aspartate kinase [Thermoanaerobaculia bacterium]
MPERPARRTDGVTVHKFGGASLADARALQNALSIVEKGDRPAVVVVSAFAGVTDSLLSLVRDLSAGNDSAVRRTIGDLESRYETAARAVVRRGADRQRLLRLIDAAFAELEALTRAPLLLRELPPRAVDRLLATGEELAAQVFAAGLSARGVAATYVSALDLVVTDGKAGQASPILPATDRKVRRILRPCLQKRRVPVVPGFIGAGPEGRVTTLGRGGSDLTATLLARALGARAVFLWKDVPGFLTADPRVVPDARVIPQLNVREAAELAYYGAKVLHPRALIPIARRVPIFVRPFDRPA